MTQVLNLPISLACLFVLPTVACSDAENAAMTQEPTESREGSLRIDDSDQDAETTQRQAISQLTLGNHVFDLDIAICFGTSTATITASDSQDRDDHPVVSAKIYDPAMSGGYSINTFSALFENSEPAEHWILHEGIVEKSGDTITASGTLKGSLLLPNDDGTRRSVPMEEGGEIPFEARIQC